MKGETISVRIVKKLEAVVEDMRRKTRREFSAEEKIRIPPVVGIGQSTPLYQPVLRTC
jgi:hypothetical protein